ncbi:MAG TPA: bifunctional oligoribonuclease/PAP phosphatase NrnA [Methylomirabilota bacterium]|nr:bifunctional oligoribonuclease/PAP phosphatase NrnA [Methylomirabilota bacterium]
MSPVPREVMEAVQGSRRVLLFAHVYPDGDVLGSQLGLGLALRAAGRTVTFACAHPVPDPFNFLPGAADVQQWKTSRNGFDLVVALDCPDPGRLGGLLEGARGPDARVLNIDHHGDNRRYGDINWVDTGAAATGEMVYDVVEAVGLPLTVDVAVNLYTAIVTDTGSFRYSNTTPKTFRVAARLVELGVDPARVATTVYETREPGGLRLLGQILQGVETAADGRVAWLVIDRGLADSPDLPEAEEFVNYPRSVRTAKVAVLFRELPDAVKVSLRAKGEVDVARIAAGLGGGGHPNAAGVILRGSLAEAKTVVLGAVRQALAAGR